MSTSLDRDESRNFFSRLRIKFLKVEYGEMTLDHTQWASLHAVNDVKRLIVWLPNSGHPGKDGGNCLWSLVSWVACTSTVFYVALPVFSKHCWSLVSWVACTSTVFYVTLPVFSKHCWVVHVSTVSSCALTSVTHFHCTATMAHLWLQILLLEATTVCSNQLHATPTVIFSWNPYPQSWDARLVSIRVPGN